jgi:hypothetical protein
MSSRRKRVHLDEVNADWEFCPGSPGLPRPPCLLTPILRTDPPRRCSFKWRYSMLRNPSDQIGWDKPNEPPDLYMGLSDFLCKSVTVIGEC